MIARSATQATLDTVTRAMFAACALIGAALAILSIRLVIDVRSATVLEAESRSLDSQAKQHSQAPHLAEVPGSPSPRGLDALRTLQIAVTQAAVHNKCQLAEFKSATQTAPYIPRYKKNLPEQPWSQMDAHFTISGRLRDVLETLRSLNDLVVPVEIDGLNIARESISADGTTTVNAQIDLRALAQGPPS